MKESMKERRNKLTKEQSKERRETAMEMMQIIL